MRRFYLQRSADETGISGAGRVAEGVEFGDGRVAMRWTPTSGITATSTALYDSLDDVETIHGHGGKTQVVLLDLDAP